MAGHYPEQVESFSPTPKNNASGCVDLADPRLNRVKYADNEAANKCLTDLKITGIGNDAHPADDAKSAASASAQAESAESKDSSDQKKESSDHKKGSGDGKREHKDEPINKQQMQTALLPRCMKMDAWRLFIRQTIFANQK